MDANDADAKLSKRPACDNCKQRKTKCDRGRPCSSCVASHLDCRIASRALEKKQRVLISSRYDEAMENVDRSLRNISDALQKLLQVSERPWPSSREATPAYVGTHPVETSGVTEGFRGDQSFKAHVERVTDALRDAASNLELSVADETLSSMKSLSEEPTSHNTPSTSYDPPSLPPQVQYPELQGRPLPPIDQVLKLLRLAQVEKQRIFIDVPVLEESEFGVICQNVYFAISDYSIADWTIVNTALFYLFTDLPERSYSQVGVTAADVRSNISMVTENIELAIQSLRLCQSPSLRACQAMSLLVTFCNKAGRSSVAWSLIAAAARMCIDLGWHRLPKDTEEQYYTERTVFWHIYVTEKGMAFTLGRTPTIHHYDVATEMSTTSRSLPVVLKNLYTGFVEFAIIVGEMHLKLFSAAAQRVSQQARIESAKDFATRLIQANEKSKECLPTDQMYHAVSVLLDVIMHCLMTITYRIIPSEEPRSSPLKCNASCIDAARQALSIIVQAFKGRENGDLQGWVRLLNILFSLVPFAPFVVLAGNTVASASADDLKLLSDTVTAIRPIASSSVSGKKLVDVCETFYHIASFSVARQMALSKSQEYSSTVATAAPAMLTPEVNLASLEVPGEPLLDYEMAPHDWDTVMNDFELGTDISAGAMASFMEPYMPFDGRPFQ